MIDIKFGILAKKLSSSVTNLIVVFVGALLTALSGTFEMFCE